MCDASYGWRWSNCLAGQSALIESQADITLLSFCPSPRNADNPGMTNYVVHPQFTWDLLGIMLESHRAVLLSSEALLFDPKLGVNDSMKFYF
jgi:hypothetical protein